MADEIARRREARRRKILENSEGRLKKLLGENVTLNHEVDSSNISTNPPTPNSVSSVGTYSPDSLTKTDKLNLHVINNKENENGTKRDDETVPALSTRHLLRDITEEMDFRYDNMSSARIEDVSLLASRIQQKESSIERIQRTSETETPKRESAKATTVKNNYWFAQNKIRRGLYVALAVIAYFTLNTDLFLLVIGQSIIFPFILVEVGIITYEFLFVPNTPVRAVNTAHSILNGALILSGVPESLIMKLTTTLSYFARIWEEFSIFLFTFLLLHWFATELVSIWA